LAKIERIQEETGVTIDPERLPKHIAIIMDGNGRWATRQELPRIMGHQQGYQTVRKITETCSDLGIKALSLYTFSTENWRRPKAETDAIMWLIETATRNELPTFQKNNIRVMVSGRMSDLSESLQDALNHVMSQTAANTGLTLNLAINYGSRMEIIEGVKEACRRISEGVISPDELTEDYFSGLLYTAGLPDPDLLIRTAGELRISNFMLWQIAYAEIWVTPTLWPEFTPTDLMTAITDYQRRTRKFGTVVSET